MRRLPSFQALRAFEAASRNGSFVLASEELHLTASAISHQIRSLEEHFGRPLFLRRSRRVEATADGLRLAGRLTQAFDEIEAACADVGRDAPTEVLALHCSPSLAAKWLGPKLPGFFAQHPGISLRLSSSADAIDLARNADLDLVIAYGAAPRRRGVSAEPLGVELVTALVAPQLAAQAQSASLNDIALIESAVSPVQWRDWCALNGLEPPPARSRPSFDRAALAVSAAVQGLGAVLESTRFAQGELARGELVALGGERFRPLPRVLHFLCCREAQRDAGKIAAFRSWLLHAAALDAPP